MNFGGGAMSYGGGNAMQANAQSMMQAEYEMDMMTDVFYNMLITCQKKCIPTTYHDGELNKGEAVCIDRCVNKYMTVVQSVGAKLAQAQQQAVPPS